MPVTASLMFMAMIFVMVTMSIPSGKRVTDVINERSTLTNPENPVVEVKDGSIEFNDVDFSYREDSKEPVLQDINLSIRSGETIGIIGATGSSKSSLVSLISRLYDVSQGSVKVGGLDVRSAIAALLEDRNNSYSKNELKAASLHLKKLFGE